MKTKSKRDIPASNIKIWIPGKKNSMKKKSKMVEKPKKEVQSNGNHRNKVKGAIYSKRWIAPFTL